MAIQWPLVIQAINIHCITPCIPWRLPLEWDEGSSLAPSPPGLWFGSDWTGCHHKLSHVYISWIQRQPTGIQVFLSRDIQCTDDVLAVSKSSYGAFKIYEHPVLVFMKSYANQLTMRLSLMGLDFWVNVSYSKQCPETFRKLYTWLIWFLL